MAVWLGECCMRGEQTFESFPATDGAEEPASIHVRSESIRVLVAEPDPVSRGLICSLLECEPDITTECVDDSRLIASIQENVPDIVILDAHTPAIRRAGDWHTLGIKSPLATIVTAYDPALLTAFTSIAVDLLVKPFDVERFEAALDLARARILQVRTQPKLDVPGGAGLHSQFLQRLTVEAGETIVLVRVEDILWIQSADRYVRLHVESKSLALRRSMRSLQLMLDPKRFLRVHRNVIVNLDHVDEFHLPLDGNMFVKLNNGVALPLRKGNRSVIRKLLQRSELSIY